MDYDARMGEFVLSDAVDDVLSCIGLGSCIGVALIDRRVHVAGLAHVMLPEAPPTATEGAPKYADTMVPALFDALERVGAARHRLEAALVGGAQMFTLNSGSGRDIGARNEAAVREQLRVLRIPVKAAVTGGSCGRSMAVEVGSGEVRCKTASTTPEILIAGRMAFAA